MSKEFGLVRHCALLKLSDSLNTHTRARNMPVKIWHRSYQVKVDFIQFKSNFLNITEARLFLCSCHLSKKVIAYVSVFFIRNIFAYTGK